jgi:Ricin-type beta-trefoil lectin domain/CHAT domain
MKILFLSANPPGSARLDLEEEVRRIEEGLQRSKLNGQFELVTKWAVDSNALRRALLEENPDVVHFSGHGEGQTGLVLLGQNKQAKPATGEALSGLFKQFPNIKCVLLNACYAEVQARAIVQHIEYVIGMKQAVRDDAAIAFATGFYDGLGYAKSIEVAFELGRNAVQFELACFSGTTRKFVPVAEEVEPLEDHLIPVLLKKEPGSTKSSIHSNRTLEASSFSEKLRAENNVTQTEAVRIYRERVQEFLSDQKLTPIETAQLAILAKILGLSETEANWILQEEQSKRSNVPSLPTQRSWFIRIGNAKKSLLAGIAILVMSGGFLAYKQTTNSVSQKFIVNSLSGKCIDVSGSPGTADGTPLVLSDCETSGLNRDNNLQTDQLWTLGSDGFIRNTLSPGKCIDVSGSPGTADGSPLVLWDCETSKFNRGNNSQTDQLWTLGSDGSIRNTLSNKCIDIKDTPSTSNGIPNNGTPLVLRDCGRSGFNRDHNLQTNQRWTLK